MKYLEIREKCICGKYVLEKKFCHSFEDIIQWNKERFTISDFYKQWKPEHSGGVEHCNLCYQDIRKTLVMVTVQGDLTEGLCGCTLSFLEEKGNNNYYCKIHRESTSGIFKRNSVCDFALCSNFCFPDSTERLKTGINSRIFKFYRKIQLAIIKENYQDSLDMEW